MAQLIAAFDQLLARMAAQPDIAVYSLHEVAAAFSRMQ